TPPPAYPDASTHSYVSALSGTAGAAGAASAGPGAPHAGVETHVPPPPPPPVPEAGGSTDLRRFPRGAFLERLGAFVLDAILVAVTNDALDFANGDGAFFLLLLVYHIIFWTWKG